MGELVSREGNCSRQRRVDRPRGKSVPVAFAQQQGASVTVVRQLNCRSQDQRIEGCGPSKNFGFYCEARSFWQRNSGALSDLSPTRSFWPSCHTGVMPPACGKLGMRQAGAPLSAHAPILCHLQCSSLNVYATHSSFLLLPPSSPKLPYLREEQDTCSLSPRDI